MPIPFSERFRHNRVEISPVAQAINFEVGNIRMTSGEHQQWGIVWAKYKRGERRERKLPLYFIADHVFADLGRGETHWYVRRPIKPEEFVPPGFEPEETKMEKLNADADYIVRHLDSSLTSDVLHILYNRFYRAFENDQEMRDKFGATVSKACAKHERLLHASEDFMTFT